jgi:glycerol-3-phosphate dehydrogenase
LPFSPGNPLAAITRRHVLHDHRDDGVAGMISVIGGKLTTATSVARECARKIGIEVAEPQFDAVVEAGEVESAVSTCLSEMGGQVTAEMARAAVSWFGRAGMDLVRSAAQDERLCAPICDGSPHMVAEAVHALRNECAVTLGDVLLRRAPVALAGEWSHQQTRQAAERIGAAVGWSAERVEGEVESFEAERASFLIKIRGREPAMA